MQPLGHLALAIMQQVACPSLACPSWHLFLLAPFGKTEEEKTYMMVPVTLSMVAACLCVPPPCLGWLTP